MLGAQVLPQVGVGVGVCVRGLSTRVQVCMLLWCHQTAWPTAP